MNTINKSNKEIEAERRLLFYATKHEMVNKMIIEMDTRNQKDEYVTEYLDNQNIKWIRNKLYSGDVK